MGMQNWVKEGAAMSVLCCRGELRLTYALKELARAATQKPTPQVKMKLLAIVIALIGLALCREDEEGNSLYAKVHLAVEQGEVLTIESELLADATSTANAKNGGLALCEEMKGASPLHGLAHSELG